MADTISGERPDTKCSDCGELGTVIKHWGPLVPKTEIGNFCGDCWRFRVEAHNQGKDPPPIGHRRPENRWDGFPLGSPG